MLLKKKIVKTVNLKIWKFSFSEMSSWRQAKLVTIYKIPGFSFFISFRFQCNACFQYAMSCFAKAYRNNFASNFWQVAICCIRMSTNFTGYYILLMEPISFQKLQPPKHRKRQIVNYVMRIQRLHKLQYHHRFFVLFSMFYPFILYSTKSKETSIKRSVNAHVSLKYKRIFNSLLMAYCFPNNFNLNLVE